MLATFFAATNPLSSVNQVTFHWAQMRSLVLLLILALLTLGPLAFIFWRDWRLLRGFRQYWKTNRHIDYPAPAAEPSVPRQTLISDGIITQATTPEPAATQQTNGHPKTQELPRPPSWTHSIPASETHAQSAASSLPLTDDPAAGRGVLNIVADADNSEPSPCDVFVDGSFVGNTPARIALDEALYVVEVKRAGYQDYRRELKVTAGSELNLRAVLPKVETPIRAAIRN